MSPRLPAVTTITDSASRYPFSTHLTLSAEACRSCSMVGRASATTVESSMRTNSPRQVPTSTHHCRVDSEDVMALRGWQLEHRHRAGAAYDPPRRYPSPQLDHAAVAVQEEHVEREPHAEGVHAAAERDQQGRSRALPRQQGEPEQPARQAGADSDPETEDLHPSQAFEPNRFHRTDSGISDAPSPPR